jgi:nicotinate dehydrogenase subunit B
LRTIIEGHVEPASADIGFMPAFGMALDDRQIAELAAYMRQRFAPGRSVWGGLDTAVARVRASPTGP